MSSTPTPTLTVAAVDTPIGHAWVASRADDTVVGAGIEDPGPDPAGVATVTARFPDATIEVADSAPAQALARYFDGDLAALDALVVDPPGTDFQHRVWQALRDIPVGETRSYGELAATLGDPGASRAVGTANGANPIWLIVPCHRVVRADGDLGGYAGGVDRKAWLLAHEGSRLA